MVRKTAKVGISALLVLLVGIAGLAAWANLDSWLAFIQPPAASSDGHDKDEHAPDDRVKLSPQAQANLRLDVRPLTLRDSYWQSIALPGRIVERSDTCEVGVPAPADGIVTGIRAVLGEVVQPGRPLFGLRLTSEALHTTQAELYRTAQDLAINDEQYKRLASLEGTLPRAQLLEVEYQQRRLQAKEKSLRFELESRGLSRAQIAGIATGQFLTHIDIKAPLVSHASGADHRHEAPQAFEVEALQVRPGDSVARGQTLGVLAEHMLLFIEGRAYPGEIPLVQRAVENAWPVRLELPQPEADVWSPWPRLVATSLGMATAPAGAAALSFVAAEIFPTDHLEILSIGSQADSDSQTAPVFLRLPNQYREYTSHGRTFRHWRYRPQQRVQLLAPVRRFTDIFVLPITALARDGVETYVLRQNGDSFERRPVHVLYQDQNNAVIAHDGSINVGNHIACNGAADLLRALKMQSSEGAGGHRHHDH